MNKQFCVTMALNCYIYILLFPAINHSVKYLQNDKDKISVNTCVYSSFSVPTFNIENAWHLWLSMVLINASPKIVKRLSMPKLNNANTSIWTHIHTNCSMFVKKMTLGIYFFRKSCKKIISSVKHSCSMNKQSWIRCFIHMTTQAIIIKLHFIVYGKTLLVECFRIQMF